MPSEPGSQERSIFHLGEIAAGFPESAETMLLDTRLTDEAAASSRVFRTYRSVPAHFHATCDEYLVVLSGKAMFFFGEDAPFELAVGAMIFFKHNVVHGMTEVLEHPFVVLAVDTPRRDPADVHFVDPAQGTPESFISSRELY